MSTPDILYNMNKHLSTFSHNRQSLIKSINTDELNCLEIGPFDDPVLRGTKVKYFDVLDQIGLKNRSLNCNRPHPLQNIPPIDYVEPNGNIKIIKDKFDVVLSCHSIEHQTDFVQHLKDVSSLLKPNGCYVIILPDKRYCFDHFIRETTFADILEHHKLKKKNHSLKSVIEHRALTCHNDCVRHWKGDHGFPKYVEDINVISNAVDEYNKAIRNNEYIDVHSLQFTPKSFGHIIDILNKINLINLKLHKMFPTNPYSGEFYVVLKSTQ